MNAATGAVRNTLFASVGIYTEYALGLVASVLVARHLGPADFGTYGLVTWLLLAGVVVASNGITIGVIKFLAELRGSGRELQIGPLLDALRRVQVLSLAAVLVVGAAAYALGDGGRRLGLAPATFALLLVSLALRAPYMFNVAIAKGFEDFRATAGMALIVAPINLAMIVVAVWLDAGLLTFLVLLAITSLLFNLVSRRLVSGHVDSAARSQPLDPLLRARIHRHLRLVAALVILGFLTASEVEVLFLNLFATAAEAGQFKVAHMLAAGATLLVPGVYSTLLLPMMAHAVGQGSGVAAERLATSTRYLLLLAAPLMAFGVLYAEPLIEAMYGPAFAPAGPALAALLSSQGIGMAATAASSYLLSADRQNWVLGMVAVTSALKIALDVVLVIRYGLAGAVVASVAVTVINAAWLLRLALRGTDGRMPWAQLLRVLLAAAVAGLVSMPALILLAPLQAVLVGGAVLAAAYAVATLAVGCWSARDLAYLSQLHADRLGGRPRSANRLLAWAVGRAAGDAA